MGFLVLACSCAGSTTQAREVMKKAGYDGWLTHPIREGKQHCRSVLDGMRRQGYDTRFVEQWIASNSSFVIFVGYDAETKELIWRDARSGSVESRVAAEALIKSFAE